MYEEEFEVTADDPMIQFCIKSCLYYDIPGMLFWNRYSVQAWLSAYTRISAVMYVCIYQGAIYKINSYFAMLDIHTVAECPKLQK